MGSPSIADRPCSNCDAWMTDDDVIDMWGDEPHPMQVVCYECPDCGGITGYFRHEVRDSENHLHMADKEFYCPSRTVYERLYGETDAFFHIESETTFAFPIDVYESFEERGVTLSDVPQVDIVPMDLAPDHALHIERGATVALPGAAFDDLHHQLFGEWKSYDNDEWTGDWYMTTNLRFVRDGSDAAAHHDPNERSDT